MNPVLSLNHFVPDSEAHVARDGRVYVYGSYDISGNTSYCSREYRVFSSADLVEWTDHGVSFRTDPAWLVEHCDREEDAELWSNQTLFAPDCVYYDGKYRLFFCTSSKGEGVADSDRPEGPFRNPRPIEGAHGDAIDPAAFVDDDGTPYLYWGQFEARGAQLSPDCSRILPETEDRNLINEAAHGFHEGSSLRKLGDLYYLVYADISRGRPTCLGYATAASPLGPFEKRGIIVDNTGCDPETWNNHGSIEKVGDRFYVFYHRSTQGTRFNRRLCIEPIEITADGTIPEVEMTTNGVNPPIPAPTSIDAARACVLSGSVRIRPADSRIGGEVLALIQNGDAACFRYIDFGASPRAAAKQTAGRFEAVASSATYGGTIEVHLDDADGELIGTCAIEPTGGFREMRQFQCSIARPTGVRAVWLVFRGSFGRLFDLKSVAFRWNLA